MSNKQMQFSIKELRARNDFSQEDLAELTGLTSRTIHSYEKDIDNLRNASYATIEKLAKALNVEVEDIFLG